MATAEAYVRDYQSFAGMPTLLAKSMTLLALQLRLQSTVPHYALWFLQVMLSIRKTSPVAGLQTLTSRQSAATWLTAAAGTAAVNVQWPSSRVVMCVAHQVAQEAPLCCPRMGCHLQ